jgi:LysM repeat protein
MNTNTGFAIGVRIQGERVVTVYDGARKHGGVVHFTTVADDQKKARFDFFCRQDLSKSWQYIGGTVLFIGLLGRAGEPEFQVDVAIGSDGIISARVRHGKHLIQKQFDLRKTKMRKLETQIKREGVREKTQSVCRAGIDKRPDEYGRRKGRKRLFRTLAISLPSLCVIIFIALFFFSVVPLRATHNWIERRDKAAVSSHAREQSLDSRQTEAQGVQLSDEPNDKEMYATETGVEYTMQKKKPVTTVAKREAPFKTAESPRALEYRIKWGDTLWRITKRYYGTAEIYPELARKNNIENPHYIIAGTSLVLPPDLSLHNFKRLKNDPD